MGVRFLGAAPNGPPARFVRRRRGYGCGGTDRTSIRHEEAAMGVMGTILGFGAGYVLGANRRAAPIQQMEGKVRDAVVQRLPVALSPPASMRRARCAR